MAVECPHCTMQVFPAADGTCPACGQSILGQSVSTDGSDSAGAEKDQSKAHGEFTHSVVVAPWEVEHEEQAETLLLQRVKQFSQDLVTFTPRLIVTPGIVVVNVLVFFAMVACGVNGFAPSIEAMVQWGANFGPKTMNGQWWRLLTSTSLHFGLLHLGFNMWVLWNLGRIVERLVGNVGFALLYFISGIAGSIASLAWNPTVVSAGASGAVFGVAGALLGVMALQHDSVPFVVVSQLRNSMGAFLVYNLLFGLAIPGIDMAAHLGGLAAGFLCGLALSQPLTKEAVKHRWRRNLGVAVGGALALFLAAGFLPDGPQDIDREMMRFAEMEKEVLRTYESLARQHRQAKIDDARFVDEVERRVLAPWSKSRQRLAALSGTRWGRQRRLPALIEYMKLREDSWSLLVEALREQDQTKLARHLEKWNAANAAVRELTGR